MTLTYYLPGSPSNEQCICINGLEFMWDQTICSHARTYDLADADAVIRLHAEQDPLFGHHETRFYSIFTAVA